MAGEILSINHIMDTAPSIHPILTALALIETTVDSGLTLHTPLLSLIHIITDGGTLMVLDITTTITTVTTTTITTTMEATMLGIMETVETRKEG